MAQNSGVDIVVLLLKVAPFVLSLVLDALQRHLHSHWKSNANDYFTVTQPDWGSLKREDVEWHYKHLTIYTNDIIWIRNTLTLSFAYIIFLHLLTLYQTQNLLLVVPICSFLILLIGSWAGLENWFTISADGRDPDTYYKYYYENRSGRSIRKNYVNHLLPASLDRKMSPKNAALISELFLIASVFGLELTSGTLLAVISIVIVILLIVIGYLVSPGLPLRE